MRFRGGIMVGRIEEVKEGGGGGGRGCRGSSGRIGRWGLAGFFEFFFVFDFQLDFGWFSPQHFYRVQRKKKTLFGM